MPFGNITDYIPALLIAALLIGVVIWQVGGSQRAEKARAVGAASRGWTYEKIGESPRLTRYVFAGRTSGGVPWRIEGVVSRSRSSSRSSDITYTRWFTDAISDPDDVVLIGPHPGDVPPIFDFGGGQLLGVMLRGMPEVEPGDAERLVAVEKVEVGTETLKGSYALFATGESAARNLLTGDVESRLIEWAMSEKKADRLPMVLLWQHGLQIRLDKNRSADMNAMDRLTALGEALAGRKQRQV